ncbi:MAG TPA: hypothetical protein VMF89_20060, partial [Polyangiales bacterium]|nr:hypothetical protein [Polyangiales bacterium]
MSGFWQAFAASPAAAQTSGASNNERWLFVPVLTAQPSREVTITQLTSPFEIELRANNQSALGNADAAQLFETRHSSEPVKLNSDEMSRLLKSVSQAARHLALGELPQAQQAMEGVYSLSGPARDYLNREAARARKIFDTCLMTAYLWERDHKRQQALRQMLECSRNFPGFRPEGRAYPPELRDVFEQAKLQLSQEAATTLLVQSRHTSGCGVRLNGIEVGKSPMSFSDVRAGVMRVQLECQSGVAGRIHSIELKPGENRLEIDPSFDAVAHSQGSLWLQYETTAIRNARLDKDLEQIAKAIGAVKVVGLIVEGTSYPRVRVHAPGPPRDVASLSYSVGEGYNSEALGAALKALQPKQARRPQQQAAATEAPVSLSEPPPPPAPPEPPPQTPVEPETDQNIVAGALLATAGVAGLATGWILYTLRYDQQVDVANMQLEGGESPFNEIQPAAPLAAIGVGALVLSISDYFWPPDDEGVPSWAWVAGGFGVAIVGAGIAIAAATSDCVGSDAPTMSVSSEIDMMAIDGTEPTVCGQYWTDPSGIFGPMIALHGMPLISLPIAYAIRAALHTDAKQTTFNIGTPAG